jgi:hypothetical protein
MHVRGHTHTRTHARTHARTHTRVRSVLGRLICVQHHVRVCADVASGNFNVDVHIYAHPDIRMYVYIYTCTSRCMYVCIYVHIYMLLASVMLVVHTTRGL